MVRWGGFVETNARAYSKLAEANPPWGRHTTAILCRAKGVISAAVAMTSCLRFGLVGVDVREFREMREQTFNFTNSRQFCAPPSGERD